MIDSAASAVNAANSATVAPPQSRPGALVTTAPAQAPAPSTASAISVHV